MKKTLALLSLVAIGVPIFGFSMDLKEPDRGALCGGRPYARISVPDGASPYVELTADGVTGPFLLDYGATRSSLSAASFSGPDGSIRTAAISLPGIEKADFHLARYYLLLQPGNGQLGVIGDDLLSQFTVQLTDNAAILSAETCRREELIARGLTPVSQSRFFSSNPTKFVSGLPNVRLDELLRFDKGQFGFVQVLERDRVGCVLLDDVDAIDHGASLVRK